MSLQELDRYKEEPTDARFAAVGPDDYTHLIDFTWKRACEPNASLGAVRHAAIVLTAADRPLEAAFLLAKWRDQRPDSIEALRTSCLIASQLGRTGEAAAHFQRLQKLKCNQETLGALYTVIHLAMGRPAEIRWGAELLLSATGQDLMIGPALLEAGRRLSDLHLVLGSAKFPHGLSDDLGGRPRQQVLALMRSHLLRLILRASRVS